MTLERVHVRQERASPRQGVVESIMKEAGLSHLSDGFAGMSVDKFRDLMIQEYESSGVFDVEDKQALFKVVKDVDRYVGLSLSREGVREATTTLNRYFYSAGREVLKRGDADGVGVHKHHEFHLHFAPGEHAHGHLLGDVHHHEHEVRGSDDRLA